MKKTNTVFFLILLSVLFSCKKQVEKERPEFIGLWHASVYDGYFIDLGISENSEANYFFYWQGKDYSYSGKARANDKHFKIGRTKYFDIIEYPHKIDTALEKHYINNNGNYKLANWKMVLDGMKPDLLHVCGTWTYYKSDY